MAVPVFADYCLSSTIVPVVAGPPVGCGVMVSVFPETQYEYGQSFVPSLIETTLPEVV